MSSKIVKIGIAILGIIFGVVETISGSKDLVDAIKEKPEESEELEEKKPEDESV